MKISGHKTDSMERRYDITDLEDMANARDLLEKRSGFVAVSGKKAKKKDIGRVD